MQDLGTDHVISGPMKGLKKKMCPMAQKHTDTQTDGHRNSKTELAQRADSVKILNY